MAINDILKSFGWIFYLLVHSIAHIADFNNI